MHVQKYLVRVQQVVVELVVVVDINTIQVENLKQDQSFLLYDHRSFHSMDTSLGYKRNSIKI